jgi:hypothetical protein
MLPTVGQVKEKHAYKPNVVGKCIELYLQSLPNIFTFTSSKSSQALSSLQA